MSDSNSVSVPRAFVADFECVAKHYKLEELGELADAKAAVKRDLENAIISFEVMATECRAEMGMAA